MSAAAKSEQAAPRPVSHVELTTGSSASKIQAQSNKMKPTRRYSGAKGQAPSIAIAKSWFTEVMLPRRTYDPSSETYRLADIGEPGELYSVWKSSVSDLSEFGIGIGLYFSSLLYMLVLTLILGALAIPAITHYASDDYSGPLRQRHIDVRVWGSAVCTRRVNVSLLDGGTTLLNDCSLDYNQLNLTLISISILWLYIFALGTIQHKLAVKLDEAEQTIQDYSVEVLDPDHDARDPDEWKEFFSQFGPVKLVTIVIDNRRLLRLLRDHRFAKQRVEFETVAGEPLPEVTKPELWLRLVQAFGMKRDLNYWRRQVLFYDHRIEVACQSEFPVQKVYVSFDTEEAQRRCLTDLNTGMCQSFFDQASSLPQHYKFRGTNVLNVKEPVEPCSVMWMNIGFPRLCRKIEQFITTTIVFAITVVVFYIVSYVQDNFGPFFVAYTISGANTIVPYIIRYAHMIEHHLEAEKDQLSLLNKCMASRLVNTAVIIYWITPFDQILSEGNLIQIQAILIAEMVTAPIIKLIDGYTRFTQHYLAPKCKTQIKMNKYFNGTEWNLAERYSDVSKTLWVALFYRTLLPSGLFITALSLIINYWVDKYCLLRIWKRTPMYGPMLADATRWHIIIIGLGALVMSGRWYAGWSYDSACTVDEGISYFKCNKHQPYFTIFFPDTQPWMSESQAKIISDLRYLILLISVATVIYVVIARLHNQIRRLYLGRYRSVGAPSPVRLSELKDVAAYIPQFNVDFLNFPLIACDMTEFEAKYISWHGDHNKYCLCSRFDFPISISDQDMRRHLSRCKEYDIPIPAKQDAV